MTKPERLPHTRARNRRRALSVAVVVAILGTFASVAYAAVSSQNTVYACFGDTSGKATSGLAEFQAQCGPNAHLKAIAAQDVGATTPTTQPTTTTAATTTTQPSGAIVPAGPVCPRSTSSSTYQGNTLTQAQASLAAYLGGFSTLADIRTVVAIGRAESSLCVRTWHWHPEQGVGIADRGWLQINSHFWPAYPDSQVFDPVGAVVATRDIRTKTGTWNTWDTWAGGQAQALQPSAATVCAAVAAVGC